MKFPQINWAFNPYNAAMILFAAGGIYATMSGRLDANDKRAEKWVPVVEELQRFTVAQVGRDKLQDDRMESVIDSVKDLRKVTSEQLVSQSRTNAEVLSQLSAIRETLAWFRATLENNGASRQPRQPQGAP